MKRLFICMICIVFTAFFSQCKRSSGDGKTIEVDSPEVYTIIRERQLDLSIKATAVDPAYVGEKEVHIQFDFLQKGELVSVLLSYWRAGERIGERTIEYTYNEVKDEQIRTVLMLRIPGSENYGLCEGLYFTYAINYKNKGGEPGVYFSQAHLIMSTKRILSDNSVEQAQCAEPPGPAE